MKAPTEVPERVRFPWLVISLGVIGHLPGITPSRCEGGFGGSGD